MVEKILLTGTFFASLGFRVELSPFSNRKLTLCAFICISLQLAVMTIPPLAGLFNVVAMNGMQWLTVAALSLTPIVVLEFGKLLSSIGRKRKKSKIL